jgi:hypothetical protein
MATSPRVRARDGAALPPPADSIAPSAIGPALLPRMPEPTTSALQAGDAALPLEPDGSGLRPARGAGASPSSAATRAPLRVHAESSDEGIRVWLGADRAGALSLEQWSRPLVKELTRWAAARGSRLAAVFLNGRQVFGGGATDRQDHPEDVPWP